jgi:hypothetical protein
VINTSQPSPDPSRPPVALQSLPTLEDTRAQIVAAIEQVAQQISLLMPQTSWSWQREESRTGGCPAPYKESEGQELLLAHYVSEVPIPEQSWRQAYDIAANAAHGLGAVKVTVFQDNAGFHDVQFSSDTGLTFRFASQKAALLTGSTGCRLPAAKR